MLICSCVHAVHGSVYEAQRWVILSAVFGICSDLDRKVNNARIQLGSSGAKIGSIGNFGFCVKIDFACKLRISQS